MPPHVRAPTAAALVPLSLTGGCAHAFLFRCCVKFVHVFDFFFVLGAVVALPKRKHAPPYVRCFECVCEGGPHVRHVLATLVFPL